MNKTQIRQSAIDLYIYDALMNKLPNNPPFFRMLCIKDMQREQHIWRSADDVTKVHMLIYAEKFLKDLQENRHLTIVLDR